MSEQKMTHLSWREELAFRRTQVEQLKKSEAEAARQLERLVGAVKGHRKQVCDTLDYFKRNGDHEEIQESQESLDAFDRRYAPILAEIEGGGLE